jgi:phosphate transport system substrate-binding protein
MKQTTLNAAYFFLLLLFTACNVAQDKNKDSITSGQLKIGVDDSYSLMMDSQIFTYTHLNKYAAISASYQPETDVMRDLMNDSVQAAVVGRELNAEELAYFKSIQRMPESILIAKDGVALVVHPENQDSVITMDQLKGIFTGRDSLWSQIYPGSTKGKIQVVFDNNKSCNARTLKEKFGISEFPSWCFALRTNEEVINYVNTNKNAMGVISISWITDTDDPTCRKYRSMIRPIGIVDPSNVLKPELPRRPFQAYVFDGTYPLRRDVYYIRTGLRGTLGTGFANHLSGEKGQLIIHKMGMVAAKTPNRTIKITE